MCAMMSVIPGSDLWVRRQRERDVPAQGTRRRHKNAVVLWYRQNVTTPLVVPGVLVANFNHRAGRLRRCPNHPTRSHRAELATTEDGES